MKNLVFLFIIVLSSSVAKAQFVQDTTLVYATPAFLKDPIRSKWNTKFIKNGKSWELQLFDRKQVLREKITFEDKALEVRKGPYAFYENGFVKEEGDYDKGHKNGVWKKYDDKTKLSETLSYYYGKLMGQYHSYWLNGNLKLAGKYRNDQKIGLWEYYYSDAKLALRETFDDEGKSVNRIYFDKEGNEIKDQSIVPMIN
jgi:antitoxin component YwqK of YwqJK toxin-antitoxin module